MKDWYKISTSFEIEFLVSLLLDLLLLLLLELFLAARSDRDAGCFAGFLSKEKILRKFQKILGKIPILFGKNGDELQDFNIENSEKIFYLLKS